MLYNIFFNASGCWCADEEQLDSLFNTNLNYIVTKTCTLYPNNGNIEPTYFNYIDNTKQIHINCKGLPNKGYEYYKNLYKKYKMLYNNKKFILSVAWENKNNNTLKLLKDYDNYIIDKEIVELNLSCPNINNNIPCYNSHTLENILQQILELKLKNIVISLKLSPYIDHLLSDKIIEIINTYNKNTNIYKYVVLCNSIPNCIMFNNGSNVLSNTYGGLSGSLNKYISLSNVHYFRKRLDKDIKIIGCGGINNINDIYDYLNNGADFIQFGSCFYNDNINCLDYNKINMTIEKYYV